MSSILYSVNKQNNSQNGYFIYSGIKYFYKLVNKENYYGELIGFKKSLGHIPIMKILYNFKLADNNYAIIYEYNKGIAKDKGLLNDLFVKYDYKNINYSSKVDIKLEKIIDCYFNESNKIRYRINCSNDIFFYDRIKSRLDKWYKDDSNFDINVKINSTDKEYSMRKIIRETKNYFKFHKYLLKKCMFTQGDPNTMNIALNPCFFDLVTSGYNEIESEFAMMFVSTLFYDNYFCPKYHSKSYYQHRKIFDNYLKNKNHIKYKRKNNLIRITCNIKLSKIRTNYVKKYINKMDTIKLSKNLKYYFVMRLLTVFNIENMSKEDYYYSIYLIVYFFDLFNDSSNINQSLLDYLDEVTSYENS